MSKEQDNGLPPGGGVKIFDQPKSIEINYARMEHLESLNLPIEGKKVLDVGCGVGHLSQFFVKRNCQVLCVDARKENIVSLFTRYPNINAVVASVENTPLSRFGMFDIVFCYGLLYHLENPISALRNMESACKEFLLLETIITDYELPLLRLEEEPICNDQALKGLACRPTPSYIVLVLRRIGFTHIYIPKIVPNHQDFKFQWKNDLSWSREGHNLRCIFVAAKMELKSPNLKILSSKEPIVNVLNKLTF